MSQHCLIVAGSEPDAAVVKEMCTTRADCPIFHSILKNETKDDFIAACVKCVSDTNETTEQHCPRAFDYFTCWNPTPFGQEAVKSCSRHFNYFKHSMQVRRMCSENGTWSKTLRGETFGLYYEHCFDDESLFAFQKFIQRLNVVGFILSVSTLSACLLIFYTFRSLLKSTRIRIHIHLFMSFILSSLANALWEIYVMDIRTYIILFENPVWCRIYRVIADYFTATNYMWMLSEGLYLYLALAVVFLNEIYFMYLFGAIGWGVPVLLIIPYAVLRYINEDKTEKCWSETSDYEYIYKIPITVSIIINCIILAYVLILLWNRFTSGMKKSVHALLILVPLLGVYHIFFMTPGPSQSNEDRDEILNAVYLLSQTLVTSFQGFAVALIFCFLNQDVQSALKSACKRTKSRNLIAVRSYSWCQKFSQRKALVSTARNGPSLINHSRPSKGAITSLSEV